MRRFEQELAQLKRRVLDMGEIAEAMLAGASSALARGDAGTIRQVLEGEERLDRFQVEVDAEAIRLITVHAPAAMDLRFLLMVARISTELERMGDQAVNNCESVELLISEGRSEPPADLLGMSEIARGMVRGALLAFEREDSKMARDVLGRDDEVDSLNARIFHDLLEQGTTPAGRSIARSMALLLVARSLERVADHATNICEEVIYWVKGDDIRHRR